MGKKIVAITTSPIPYGDNITDGPGFRLWNLFQQIALKNEVVILSLYESFHLKTKNDFETKEDKIRIKGIRHNPSDVAFEIEKEKPDILYLPWSTTPFLSRVKKRIPTILDYVGTGLLEEYATKGYIPITLLQMKLKSFWLGDFLITAGQRERYYLLGLLAASKKLSQARHNQKDPLIHVIPMTPPANPPISTKKVIEKKADELVILVAGALLPWYDYSTFFTALKILVANGKKNFKVLLMGGNIREPRFDALIRKMGDAQVPQKQLFFTGLIPFKERANYYLSADIAINIPSITVEDELSVRTRVVDYIWASLPILSPAHDEYSAAVINKGAGFSYKAGNPESLADAISIVMDDKKKLELAKSRMPLILENKFTLSKYISPLESFIENPYVDPLRLSTKGVNSEIFLWARDIFNLLKR
jgi:glycosyltransferase involved in cell wall biosynthesis